MHAHIIQENNLHYISKNSKIIFVITTSNLHQILQFLAQRWQTIYNYMMCTHFPPHLIHVNALLCFMFQIVT